MNNLIYYIFALILIIGTCYIVFGLGHSGWWFLMLLILLDIKPTAGKK